MASRNKGKWTVQDLNVFIHALLKKKQMKNNELHEASSQIQKMDIKKEHYYLFEKWQIGRHLNYLIHEKYLQVHLKISLTSLRKKIMETMLTYIVDQGCVENGL